ncbi:CapA family protein [Solitalea koreensis]|uniref:Poly-gamma-glutamate synthesis protein (Capsule biosynthesis protein) n=1 Tax=Solitalea koreensis TaxID=543615 RepID=A0A521AD09_9SPHI|nr:CapA family protein [Solitalea koreensis]SMO32658.1 poly-gamma-glutamate synthesis protein (capsule biosynthesis protein) [Solitalea koreensis]
MANSFDTTNSLVTIGFGGDVMMGGLVNEKIAQAGHSYPWGNALPLFKSNDLNIVNLEAPLTTYKKEQTRKAINFKADPSRIQTLMDAGINVVNIANDHILDFHEEGLMDTIEHLRKSGIEHVGAGADAEMAAAPVILTRKDVTIGILGFTDNEPYWAAIKRPGTNYINIGDIRTVQWAIKPIRDQVDVLIVTIHWGDKMVGKPLAEFVDFAHQIIDAGADIIHGHGNHTFQGIEVYNGKVIMYDTGDLIDDYNVDPELRNDHSLFVTCEIDKTGVKKLKLTPLLIQEMQANLAKNEDYDWAISRIQELSAPFNTFITKEGEVHLNHS